MEPISRTVDGVDLSPFDTEFNLVDALFDSSLVANAGLALEENGDDFLNLFNVTATELEALEPADAFNLQEYLYDPAEAFLEPPPTAPPLPTPPTTPPTPKGESVAVPKATQQQSGEANRRSRRVAATTRALKGVTAGENNKVEPKKKQKKEPKVRTPIRKEPKKPTTTQRKVNTVPTPEKGRETSQRSAPKPKVATTSGLFTVTPIPGTPKYKRSLNLTLKAPQPPKAKAQKAKRAVPKGKSGKSTQRRPRILSTVIEASPPNTTTPTRTRSAHSSSSLSTSITRFPATRTTTVAEHPNTRRARLLRARADYARRQEALSEAQREAFRTRARQYRASLDPDALREQRRAWYHRFAPRMTPEQREKRALWSMAYRAAKWVQDNPREAYLLRQLLPIFYFNMEP